MIRTAAAVLALTASVAAAADFGSVGTPGAILYDAPSANAVKVAVAPRGMPLELLSLIDRWVKVRDLTGQAFWIERGDLVQQRMVIATMTATIHSAARDGADTVFRVDRGVVLELLDPAPAAGWARVRHQDGSAGFVRAREVWGL